MTLKDQLEKLAKEYPLILHTDARSHIFNSATYESREKDGHSYIPSHWFCHFYKTGKAENTMTEDEWEEFYNALSEQLKRDYPDLYERIFSPNETGKGKNAD